MSDSWGVTWNVTPDVAWGNVAKKYALRVESQIVAFADSLLEPIQAWMKENAPWEDISGDAREGLYTDIIHIVREGVKILLSHGPAIPYAIWLELANAGRFSILPSAVDHWSPVFFRGVQEIVRGMSQG